MIIHENINIQNSIGINSVARYLIEISSKDDFAELSLFLKNINMRYMILGEGTNIIPPDFFDGVIIKPNFNNIKMDESESILSVGSAYNWHELVKFCLKRNINGFENLSLIPGSVGASPIQNIGAYGADVSHLIKSIEGFDLNTKKLVSISNKDCNFSYRNSSLKNSSILIYSINFISDHPESINYNYASIKEHIASNHLDIDALSSSIISKIICNIRSKVLPNHELIHNAGSFFKNPIVSEDLISFSHFSREELIIWLQGDGLVKVGAARLIELIKDKLIPSANVSISDTHNLVLITNGKATQHEVLEFSGQIQSLVKDFFNLDLEIEPTVIEA